MQTTIISGAQGVGKTSLAYKLANRRHSIFITSVRDADRYIDENTEVIILDGVRDIHDESIVWFMNLNGYATRSQPFRPSCKIINPELIIVTQQDVKPEEVQNATLIKIFRKC